MNHACEDNSLEAKFFRASKRGQDSDLPERVAFVATRCVYVRVRAEGARLCTSRPSRGAV